MDVGDPVSMPRAADSLLSSQPSWAMSCPQEDSKPLTATGQLPKGFCLSLSHCLSSSSANRYLCYRISQRQTSCKVRVGGNSSAGVQRAPLPQHGPGAPWKCRPWGPILHQKEHFHSIPRGPVCPLKFEKLCSRAQAQFEPFTHNLFFFFWFSHKIIVFSKNLPRLTH